MLLITFTLMLSLRGIHYHYETSHECDVKTTGSTACTTVKAVCNVCDFVFQKANAIKNTVYITPVPYSIVKYLSFDTPCVYLRIFIDKHQFSTILLSIKHKKKNVTYSCFLCKYIEVNE